MTQYKLSGRLRLFTGALSAAALTIAAPQTASACGGFFCQQVPVDQSGEQILFSVEGTTVTAHIQIAYQGEAEKFSWVLPLPAVPELGVGTDEVFTQLRQVTDPTFRVDWQPVDGCSGGQDCMYAPSAGGGGDPSEGTDDDKGVDILAQGDVGAFEYKVVQSDTGDALFTWLNDNGYDQPEASKPLVTYYVNQKYVFLGLRLQKDKSVGEMQPVVLKYTSADLACVPLKLTAIAAMADMPVTTWILAHARAVPLNFFHVVLNAKAYPWLTCGGGYYSFGGGNTDCSKAYRDLVTEASNAANGHAFVTEYAGTSTLMTDRLYTEGRFDVSKLAAATDPVLFLQELLNQGFPRGGQIQAMIRKWIPKPEGLPADCADDAAFYSFNMETCIQYMPNGYVFDAVGFAADVDENVVAPLKAAQALFQSQPYLTRLFTTISPDEMDKDPMFSFNPDLPDVAREHVVKATPLCAAGSNQASQVTLEYPDGSLEIVGATFNGCSPPVLTGDNNALAYAEIQVLSESGAPEAVAAGDVDKREAQLEVRAPSAGQASLPQNPAVAGTIDARAGTFGTRPSDVSSAPSAASSGCTATGQGTATGKGSTAVLGLLGLGLALLALRRRV